MTFERYNKKIKNLVGNKNHPISSLANALLKDAGRLLAYCLPLLCPRLFFTHSHMYARSFAVSEVDDRP